MSSLPSQKTLGKYFWAISISLGLALGIWTSLYLVTKIEELQEYDIIYRYWYGVYLASRFISLMLAACWVVILILRIVVAIHNEINAKPDPGDDDWKIDTGDLSDFD